jgi:hypothetical protein
VSPELQSRCGKRYCDEAELLPLLLSHGFVRQVRTIVVSVHPVGGDSFNITLDAALPTVGEAKAGIARVQGTKEDIQELYKVATRADGKAFREDDAEPEVLDDVMQWLGAGELLAMVVKEAPPLIWHTYPEDCVTQSKEGGLVASTSRSLVTSGIELTVRPGTIGRWRLLVATYLLAWPGPTLIPLASTPTAAALTAGSCPPRTVLSAATASLTTI